MEFTTKLLPHFKLPKSWQPNTSGNNNQPRKKNQMNKILIAYIIGLIVGAGATLCIVEQLLK
jgi:hypothetical protein